MNVRNFQSRFDLRRKKFIYGMTALIFRERIAHQKLGLQPTNTLRALAFGSRLNYCPFFQSAL